jgi:hypothetical protein
MVHLNNPVFIAMSLQPSYIPALIDNQLDILDLTGNRIVAFFSFSLNTDNRIGNIGATKLSEALKANTSLTLLNLRCNTRIVTFINSYST